MRTKHCHEIIEIPEYQIDRDAAVAIVSLTNSIWPSLLQTEAELVEQLLERAVAPDGPVESRKSRFVAYQGSRIIAHSRVFVRRILTSRGEMDVLGLAGVCTDPEFREHGLGKAVVRKALEKRTLFGLEVCLFQTGVISFYESLGGRTIDNPFVNRADPVLPDSNPWWDEAVMIIPATAEWPAGTIDLGGKGY
jgi:predicted N-acetyltransferase YhbS